MTKKRDDRKHLVGRTNLPDITPTERELFLADGVVVKQRGQAALKQHKYDRAVQQFSARTVLKMSLAEYSKHTSIPITTLFWWEIPCKVSSKEQWNSLAEEYGEYQLLRHLHSGNSIESLRHAFSASPVKGTEKNLVIFLEETLSGVQSFVRLKSFDPNSMVRVEELIRKVQDGLNRLQMYLDKNK